MPAMLAANIIRQHRRTCIGAVAIYFSYFRLRGSTNQFLCLSDVIAGGRVRLRGERTHLQHERICGRLTTSSRWGPSAVYPDCTTLVRRSRGVQKRSTRAMADPVPVLLVTANVGSIFEEPHTLLPGWIREFLTKVRQCQPSFLALHCQEVGGKNYEKTMTHVADFIRTLMSSEELVNYTAVRIFLDEDFSCVEKFTALGNLYFLHQSLTNLQMWDFQECRFHPVVGKEVHSGNIERVSTKEKVKFPQEFFPECKWSRKGYMRTRWSIHGTAFDLINIHLFHDESNFIAMESFPSLYTKNRQGALDYTLNRLQNDKYDKVPFFIFGDFNFRLDTHAVVEKITRKAPPVHVKSAKNGDVTKVLYRHPKDENRVLLTVERKVFSLEDHEEAFCQNDGKWLQEHDKEPKLFKDRLFEFDIEFPPSYPYKEESTEARSYMRTRCPAWCDRILLGKSAKALVLTTPDDTGKPPVSYQIMGTNVCMGDHKPVALSFRMVLAAGTGASRHKEQRSRSSSTCPACCIL